MISSGEDLLAKSHHLSGALQLPGARLASKEGRGLPPPGGRQEEPSEERGCAPAIAKGPHVGAPERDPPRRGWRSLAGLAEGRGRRWHRGQKARRTVPKEPAPARPARPARARRSMARAPRVPERGPDAGRVSALDLSQDPLVLRSCLQALRLRHLSPIHRMGAPDSVSPSSDQLTFRSHSHPKLQSLPSPWLPAGRPRPQARHAPFVTASADIPRNAFWDL